MLEKLAEIDWAKIHHSHGTAEKFPIWLRELASDDPVIRQTAYWKIDGYSFHQQSIYEVTPYIVPFLLELLEAPSVQDKHTLLDLLTHLTQIRLL